MNPTPTPELRAKLRGLHAKATPGEWRIGQKLFDYIVIEADGRIDVQQVAGAMRPNAELIVAAHNALPGLLDALDASEKEIARLQAGIYTRDQRIAQHCAEAAAAMAENKRMREALERIRDSDDVRDWAQNVAAEALGGQPT